jgi:oligoribonuclease NrnB/cAMP/cGMP phosphodiesterase (DHH superfamily)
MRILTRPDFDGIVCAALLSDALNIVAPVKWVEPNAMQHGMVDVQPGDVIANLGYHENCELWFDHHESNRIDKPFKGVYQIAPSAAGIIFNYFKNNSITGFKKDYATLVKETDKIDSANLSLDEALNPGKYPFLSLSMTILSHNYEDERYWNRLVELLQCHDIEEILTDPEVEKRVAIAIDTNNSYIAFLKKYTTDYGKATVSDFRPLGRTPIGNRFLVFYLFPGSLVNVRVRFDNKDKDQIRISIGHSIFNHGCNVNAGLLCSQFGGGGHRGAGACTVPENHSKYILSVILDVLEANLPLTIPIPYKDDYLKLFSKL